MIGWRIAKRWGVPHVIDYRDPWHGAFFFPKRPKLLSRLEYALEQAIVSSAAAVISVQEDHANEMKERTSNRIPVHLIHNGYDEADFDGVTPRSFSRLTIAHTGILYNARGALPIVIAIEKLVSEGAIDRDRIEFLQVGPTDAEVAEHLDRLRRTIRVTVSGSVEHGQAISIMMGAQVLYLPTLENAITGKVFEYLRACRPILAVGRSATNLNAVLATAGRPEAHDPEDIDGIKSALLAALTFRGRIEVTADVGAFSRQNQAAQVAEVLDESAGRHFSKIK